MVAKQRLAYPLCQHKILKLSIVIECFLLLVGSLCGTHAVGDPCFWRSRASRDVSSLLIRTSLGRGEGACFSSPCTPAIDEFARSRWFRLPVFCQMLPCYPGRLRYRVTILVAFGGSRSRDQTAWSSHSSFWPQKSGSALPAGLGLRKLVRAAFGPPLSVHGV